MISKEITIKQKVNFIIENDNNFKKFKRINFKIYPKIFLFVDKKFFNLNKNFLKKIGNKKYNKIFLIKINSKESIKEFQVFEKYTKYLIRKNCSKHDLLVAIGGGTIIDLISFVSSIFLRGIKLFLIPTNLIGMADASTAGKTGLNSGQLKNLIGTIYLPEKVYINTNFLITCSKNDLRQGWSEIFKYGLLGSKKLINMIDYYFKYKSDRLLLSIIKKTINIRLKIMKINPMASNLGHTFGHAIEKITNNKILHGDAISIGTVFALKFANKNKIISRIKKDKIIKLMENTGLKTYTNIKFNPNIFLKYMLKDKKSYDNKVGLILIKDIGKPKMVNSSPFYYCEKSKMLSFLKIINK